MPDEHDDDLEPDEPESSVIRKLRQDLKSAQADAAEAKALREELAFNKAKLDLSDKQRKALMATHEGDMSPEALHQTAVDLGFVKAPEPPVEEPQVSADEQAAHQRVNDATQAAEAVDGKVETLEDRIAKAKDQSEVEQIMVSAGVGWNDHEI